MFLTEQGYRYEILYGDEVAAYQPATLAGVAAPAVGDAGSPVGLPPAVGDEGFAVSLTPAVRALPMPRV